MARNDDTAHGAQAFGKDLEATCNKYEEDEVQGKGKWWHAAYHLTTTICTPAAYAPIPFAFSYLGWAGGLTSLIVGTLVTYYNSMILASLHRFNGTRHKRYAELGQDIFGAPGYWTVTVLQQIASIGNNIAIQIAAGLSLKAVYLAYYPEGSITLQQWIIVFAAAQIIISQFPDLHSLRLVSIISTTATIAFTVTAVGLAVYNGQMLDRSTVTYEVATEDRVEAIMGIFSALGTIAFTFGDTILPEIQYTVRAPVKRNMYKGITLAYSVLVSIYLAIGVAGYWAFGFGVFPWLLASMMEPNWALVMANIFAVVQIVGCYQVYCRPTYEWAEVRLMRADQDKLSNHNKLARALITTTYIVLMTVVCCAIPFFGDFVALVGALAFTPMDFIVPVVFYLAVRKPARWVWALNSVVVLVYSVIAVLGSIAAFRYIVMHAINYSAFANL